MDMPERLVREMPAPTADRVLLRVLLQAILATQPRKRSEKLLRTMAEILANEESVSDIFPIRPPADHADVQQARREAVAAFRGLLPVFLAMLNGG